MQSGHVQKVWHDDTHKINFCDKAENAKFAIISHCQNKPLYGIQTHNVIIANTIKITCIIIRLNLRIRLGCLSSKEGSQFKYTL